MIPQGFYFTGITLTGPNVPDASIKLGRGLNVISGPSDTGKTFIAQCIDFATGATKSPKDIPEASTYDTIVLSIETYGDARQYTLSRSLRGGNIKLVEGDRNSPSATSRVLLPKHQPNREDTVSSFLLELSGLAGRKICTNKLGKLRELSFRDLAKLVLIHEERVITEQSPLLSGNPVSKTAERSVFKLMLTGLDDSSVVQSEDPQLVKTRVEAKSGLLEEFRAKAQAELNELELDDSRRHHVDTRLGEIEELFSRANEGLLGERQGVISLEKRRRKSWTHLRQVQSRLDVVGELQRRFGLLREQYSSDLRRLEAISEAGTQLGEMKEERCPLCGAPPEQHDREHESPIVSLEAIAQACRAEAQSTNASLAELDRTIQDNADEIARLTDEVDERQRELDAAREKLEASLRPRVQEALQRLRDSQAERDKYRRARELLTQINELDKRRQEPTAVPPSAPSTQTDPTTSASAIEKFAQEVESLLRSWNFPELERVTFSDNDEDIIISGRPRSSHGKGVRAVTHAAFATGLLKYCAERAMPHCGYVLIDSPLVVYREPDVGEPEFATDLKAAFYRSLASQFKDVQVLVIENEDPPDDMGDEATIIRFTGTEQERRGFIPPVGEQ